MATPKSKPVSTLSSEFKKASDTLTRGVAFIIYGDPGSGKTTMATTLPQEETLIISSEAGEGPLLGTECVVFQLSRDKRLSDLQGLYKFLRTEEHPFKYVVLDNISEMESWMLHDVVTSRDKQVPNISEYKDSGYKMDEYLHLFRDLIYKGITVVFTAWEIPLEYKNSDGVIESKTFPKLAGKLARSVSGLVDVVGHLTVHEKSQKRWLKVAPTDQWIAKSQLKGIGDDDGWEEADFGIIMKKLYAFNYKKKKKEE